MARRTDYFYMLPAAVLIVFISSVSLDAQGIQKVQEEGLTISSIPMVQPVSEKGVGVALVDRYHLSPKNKKTSSSSSTGLGGFITGNESWGIGVAQTFFLKEDRWLARTAATYADVRYNFYGIGTEAGEAGVSVLIKQKGFGVWGEALYRLHESWYAGPRYRLLDTKSSFNPNPEFDDSVISPDELDVRIAELGPRVIRDTRSDFNYPREGSFFDARAGFNGSAVGSQLQYQTYDIAYSKYISLGPSQVLAVRGAGCLVGGTVPFFDLCLLSATENLRGYQASRYRDRSMVATQAEYRIEAWKRIGFVAFGGIGEIAPKFRDFNFNDVLPGGGAGVRYRITKESHVNVRFDYAWGKNSHQAYFFIGEAF